MLERIETNVRAALETASDEVSSLLEEVENWRNNMDGANLEHTGKYKRLDDTAGYLTRAQELLDQIELADSIKGAKVIYLISNAKRKAKATRCSEIMDILEWVAQTIEAMIGKTEQEARQLTWLTEEIREIISWLDSCDFS